MDFATLTRIFSNLRGFGIPCLFWIFALQSLQLADPRPAPSDDGAREGRQALEREKNEKKRREAPKIVVGGAAREFGEGLFLAFSGVSRALFGVCR